MNKQGFITRWLVSGLKSEPFEVEQTEKDQIRFEQYLRRVGIDQVPMTLPGEIRLGEPGCGECPWEYYYKRNHWFVDLSNTCPGPRKLEAYGATILRVKEAMELEAVLWTYPAVELWVNGELVCQVVEAVYKPMASRLVTLKLKEGDNRIFVRMQTVGVRDSRNMFGLQLLGEEAACAEAVLPDEEGTAPVIQAENWLEKLRYGDGKLECGEIPEFEAFLEYKEADGRLCRNLIKEKEFVIPKEICAFSVSAVAAGQVLKRTFELAERFCPIQENAETVEESHRHIYERLAAVPYQTRGSGAKFSVFHVLARYALGMETEKDREYLLRDLSYIDDRIDCSDFVMAGILRLVKNYTLDEALMERIRQSLLNYRYWMDEEGSDGMCFWSENHALMFHGAQMAAGSLFPDDIFTRSGRTGREQAAVGEARCRSWLEEVEKNGFEEFISATYTSVTVAALLTLIDFGPEDISRRAEKALDKNLEMLCLHVFDGVVVGPQGRVYRDVIYPFKQSVQVFIHFINKDLPTSIGMAGSEPMWLAAMATTRYRVPEYLLERMKETGEFSYTSQNAKIHLRKTSDYVLTSVESPRNGYEEPKEEGEIFSTRWVKRLNTRYHGKTLFEPGVYGYQQHMWYAALANDCPIFVNHPGISTDSAAMRPGYWYGNGVFPALTQKEHMLAAIYSVPKEHPIHFTHLYWPMANLDETRRKEDWIFGRKGDGYVGIWCSRELEAFDDVLTDREFRAYGSNTAYVCVCGSRKESGSFETFMESCRKKELSFDEEALILKAEELGSLTYEKAQDDTQYI